MRLNEVSYTDALPVEGYGPGFFRIGGTAHEAPLAVLAGGVTAWGGLDDAAPLLAAAGEVDVILFGMGPEIAHLPTALRETLEAAGIGTEVMSSPQACRTYNVLLGEGRRVGLAVLSV
ncbi:MAG: Mth938-like domain-containing protein [Pseudomonadota bacterium]